MFSIRSSFEEKKLSNTVVEFKVINETIIQKVYVLGFALAIFLTGISIAVSRGLAVYFTMFFLPEIILVSNKISPLHFSELIVLCYRLHLFACDCGVTHASYSGCYGGPSSVE